MPIEHKNITDPDNHEPKGISTAVTDTIYVADGIGGGSWERSGMSDHAEMAITNNATATAVTAAVDATLNTDTDYTKITAGWASTHLSGITFNVDELVAAVDGDYKIDFWATVKIPLNNNFIGIKYAINDTAPYSLQKIISQSVTANDYRNLFASAIVTLSATNTVSIYLAGTKTDNLVIEEGGMQMTLLHAN
mgnify:CR=1 FL=1